MVPATVDAPVTPATYNVPYTWMIASAAALGGLLFGYDWVVIGGAKPFYEKFFHLVEPWQQGWAMSCALVGCLAGALISGPLSDHFGRKRLLSASAFLFLVSSLGTAMAGSFTSFVVWRMCGGVAIGLASNLSPMYISEISPAEARGRLISLNQLAIVVGILWAQFINWEIARPVMPEATAVDILNSWNGQVGWRWMFGITALPAALFLGAMLAVPESPRWLALNGQTAKAGRLLARIGGEASSARVLASIGLSHGNQFSAGKYRELVAPRARKTLVLGIVLAVFQQWCGINVIFNYAEEVFSAAGYGVSQILFNIVLTGVANLIFTFVAIRVVDQAGRRLLMLIGSAGLTIIYLLLGAGYQMRSQGLHMLLLVVAAIAAYAMSLAPVTWVIIAEIFPNRIRGEGMSIAVASLWTACFVLAYTFPLLNRNLGPATTFWMYSAICLAGFFFIKLRLPETKGKSLEEIEQLMV